MYQSSQRPEGDTVRLLGLCGSLRRHSYSAAILKTVFARMPSASRGDIFTLDDVPLYNEDHDGDATPSSVQLLRKAIHRADGLVVMSPEYNHGISGVLKNALDWASRPAKRSVLLGKPTLIMTASTASTGGVRAQYQTRETLTGALARVLVRPEIVIGLADKKVSNGELTDQPTLDFCLGAVNDLLAEIKMIQSHHVL